MSSRPSRLHLTQPRNLALATAARHLMFQSTMKLSDAGKTRDADRMATSRRRRRCLAILSLTTALFACTTQPSTPYRPMREGQEPFGYASEAIGELLYRVEFWGSNKTPERTTKAFALFRAAELARMLNMVAFTIEDGPFDRSVLEGDDVFSSNDRIGPTFPSGADTVGPVRRVRTSTIWIPIPVPTPEERYARTASKLVILRVRMHPRPVASGNPRTFTTEEVLDRLGPRIVRGQPS